MRKLLILLFLFPTLAYAQVAELEGNSLPFLNQQLRENVRRVSQLETNTLANLSGVVPLASGGTGEILVDPGADKLLFWDDSESKVDWKDTIAARHEIITSDGNFTAGSGVTKIWVTICGGGGGGGRGGTNGGGGGGGACIVRKEYTVVAGNNYAVDIGAGGVQGTPALKGDDTTIETTDIVAEGGLPGDATNGGNGGAKSWTLNSGSGGVHKVPGGDGQAGAGSGGAGGGTIIGVGAAAATTAGPGNAGAANTGAGGSGGQGQDGSPGGSGYCLVEW